MTGYRVCVYYKGESGEELGMDCDFPCPQNLKECIRFVKKKIKDSTYDTKKSLVFGRCYAYNIVIKDDDLENVWEWNRSE